MIAFLSYEVDQFLKYNYEIMDLKIFDGFYPTEDVVVIGIYFVLYLASSAFSGGIWVLLIRPL